MSGPGDYGPSSGYPPPQGHNQPISPSPGQAYDDRYRGYTSPAPNQHAQYGPNSGSSVSPGYVPPHRPPPSGGYDPNYFPPPPQSDYRDDGYGPAPPRSEYTHFDRGYDRAPMSDYGPPPSGFSAERGYALAPYDQEKAEAEDRRGWEEEQRYGYGVPPPPSDYDLRKRRYEDDRYYDDRSRRSYSEDRSYDSRDRRDEGRRRDSRRASPPPKKKDIFGGGDGERGLGAQILGGAVGGLAGHEFGKGNILETLGGVVAGAIGAKVLENQYDKRKEGKRNVNAPYKGDMGDSSRYTRDERRGSRQERQRSTRRRSDSDNYSSEGSPPPRRK